MICEIRGIVGVPDHEEPCKKQAKRGVSVEGLSPVRCCMPHAEAMRDFWGQCYEVIIHRLNWWPTIT